MPIKATDLKRGQALMWDGQLHITLDTDHVKPGKGPAYVQAKMKNIETGTIKTHRINSSDKLEDATIDRRTMQYLYDSSGHGAGPFVFMDNETFDQIEIDSDVLPTDQSQWLKESVEVTVLRHEGRPLGVEMPAVVELTIAETTPQPKGATATNQYKDATLETGLRIKVPPFVEPGEMVRIDTRTGEYIERV